MISQKSRRNRDERSRVSRTLMILLLCIQLLETRICLVVEGFSPKVNTILSKPSLSHRKAMIVPASNPSVDSMESSSGSSAERVNPHGLFHPDDNAYDIDATTAGFFSTAAEWHRQRRKQMIQKYRAQILPLEQQTSSYNLGIPLLLAGNLILLGLSLLSAKLSTTWVFGLALFPGSILSLWQLQILHDGLHGSLFPRQQNNANTIWGIMGRKQWQDMVFVP